MRSKRKKRKRERRLRLWVTLLGGVGGQAGGQRSAMHDTSAEEEKEEVIRLVFPG